MIVKLKMIMVGVFFLDISYFSEDVQLDANDSSRNGEVDVGRSEIVLGLRNTPSWPDVIGKKITPRVIDHLQNQI